VEPLVFERGELVYLVGPVAPFDPSSAELDELAFAKSLREQSPNENLVWMRGQYVEADRANANGHEWSSNEIAIKSVTPRLMPVTLMHDPRVNIGLIADTALLTPDADKVPRSRIDTTLGLWGHRFPEVIEQARENHKAGTLMQSMECLPAYYDCGECGRRFPKLPGRAEEATWCSHLRGEGSAPATRRLGNVTFTGSGLILGTLGATGAFDRAHLEVFEEEVAEAHQRAHTDDRQRRRTRMDEITIKRSEYDALQEKAAKAARADDLASENVTLKERAEAAEKKVESEETAKVAAEKERDEEKQKREGLEETARVATLGKERIGSSAAASPASSGSSPAAGSRSRPASSPTRTGRTASRSSRRRRARSATTARQPGRAAPAEAPAAAAPSPRRRPHARRPAAAGATAGTARGRPTGLAGAS